MGKNKTLDLYKLWEICNKLSDKQGELAEDNIYVSLMGTSSDYCNPPFETFLEHYSFRFEEKYLIVFNDDLIPWEDYRTNDFSYVLKKLLDMSDEEVDKWIEEEVDRQVYLEKLNKSAEKDRIKEEIKRLERQLEL